MYFKTPVLSLVRKHERVLATYRLTSPNAFCEEWTMTTLRLSGDPLHHPSALAKHPKSWWANLPFHTIFGIIPISEVGQVVRHRTLMTIIGLNNVNMNMKVVCQRSRTLFEMRMNALRLVVTFVRFSSGRIGEADHECIGLHLRS